MPSVVDAIVLKSDIPVTQVNHYGSRDTPSIHHPCSKSEYYLPQINLKASQNRIGMFDADSSYRSIQTLEYFNAKPIIENRSCTYPRTQLLCMLDQQLG